MSQIYTYDHDPYRSQLNARVVNIGEDGGHPFAELDDTIFFPEGGGQPADRGRLGEVEVLDARKIDGTVRHFLSAPVSVGPTILQLDWPRRFDHMQQHTAQHLLTAVALERHGWFTTAFHLRVEECDIELNVPQLSPAQLETLEEAAMEEIRSARPISARRVTPEDYAAMNVRSRGLPAGHRGDVRLVEIEGLDLNTCGGTHLHSTAEIESLKLLGAESRRGGTLLRWLAGGRVRRRLGEHEARNAELRSALDTSDEDLVQITQLKLEQLKEAQRQQKRLSSQLAEAVAETLAGRPDALVEAHFDDAEMSFLQQVARRVTGDGREGVLFLTASHGDDHFFVLACGPGGAIDLPALGKEVATALGGRGGGSGQLFQGKTASLAERERALEIAHTNQHPQGVSDE